MKAELTNWRKGQVLQPFSYPGNVVLKTVIYCLFDIRWKKFRTIIWSKSLYPAGISFTLAVQRWNVIYSGISFSLQEEGKNSFFSDKCQRTGICPSWNTLKEHIESPFLRMVDSSSETNTCTENNLYICFKIF